LPRCLLPVSSSRALEVRDGEAERGAGAKKRGEPTAERKARARKTLARLEKLYAGATTELDHRSALELLVATIPLRAVHRCHGEQGRAAPISRGSPMRRRSPRRIRSRSRRSSAPPASSPEDEEHPGRVPPHRRGVRRGGARDHEELITLPGVARKTANVVLGTWFEVNEGIVVDTHVGRVSRRLGLSWSSKDDKDAVKIEEGLMRLIPREEWTFFGHADDPPRPPRVRGPQAELRRLRAQGILPVGVQGGVIARQIGATSKNVPDAFRLAAGDWRSKAQIAGRCYASARIDGSPIKARCWLRADIVEIRLSAHHFRTPLESRCLI